MTPAEYLATLRKPRKRRGSNPESALTNAIVKALTARGYVCWRNNSGTIKIGNRLFRGSPTGSPDVFLILPPHGRLCGFEVKMPGKKLRASQQRWSKFASALGVRVHCTESVSATLIVAEHWRRQEQQ
jgi:VRR-NUC domain-containing protein